MFLVQNLDYLPQGRMTLHLLHLRVILARLHQDMVDMLTLTAVSLVDLAQGMGGQVVELQDHPEETWTTFYVLR